MNDNDIIKALECYIDDKGCSDRCPYHKYKYEVHCMKQHGHDLLGLINRQKAQIDILCNSLDVSSQNLENMTRAMSNIAIATRIAAIQEFAKKLKKRLVWRTEYDEGGWDVDLFTVTEEDINNLVKEMTED